ncbi:phage tail tube protein [Xenophilus sp.]|uniref:phage tail tube protein n=1 Tax=Xenophilus sp. TaxID=1873499 RepID=UPI0037DDBCBC
MGTVIKSQGTELFWASGASAATRVVCATSISGLGGAKDQVETSCLDNTEDKTFIGGLGNPGQVTVGFNVHKGEISHEDILALKAAGTVVSWGIYSSDAVTPPTVTGSVMQPVVGRVSAIFQGYVADINIDIQGNDIWKGTITIQRSGPVTFDLLIPAS